MNSHGKSTALASGTRLAYPRTLALLVLPALTIMGCLVTDKVDLELLPNTPSALYQPTALAADEPSVQSIYSLDLDIFPFNEINLRAIILDPDIDQILEWRVFLDYDPDELVPKNPILFGTVAPNDGAEPEWRFDLDSDEILIQVSTLELAGIGCHKLELRVSSDFEDASPSYDPKDTSGPVPDVGSLIWWVSVTDTANPTVDISTCP